MTTIQIFALIGVFLIGVIVGSYLMLRFMIFATGHSTVVGIQVGECENPECARQHITLHTLNATQSLGTSHLTMTIEPKIAAILIEAFRAQPATPPPIPLPPT